VKLLAQEVRDDVLDLLMANSTHRVEGRHPGASGVAASVDSNPPQALGLQLQGEDETSSLLEPELKQVAR
jgi:hypothetical protein